MAALLGISCLAATTLLRSLARKHLVFDLGHNRFGLHDLLRAYARETCDQTETVDNREATLARLFDHYLHTADLTGRIVMPHRLRLLLDGRAVDPLDLQSRHDALRWLDLERRNLEAMCSIDAHALDRRRWQLAYTLRD